jgi:maltooligosyltrehalose trehalohydrolase
VELVITNGETVEMQRGDDGVYTARAIASPGAQYRYRIDGGTEVADPASQAQAGDAHDASIIVDHHYP